MADPWDDAYDALVDEVNDGRIDEREFRREVAALRDEQRWRAEDAAREAYDQELYGW